MKVNYHTHSRFCDGKGEPREYVEYAIGHGFSHLGFSGHSPVPFPNDYAIQPEHLQEYCDEIRSLKSEYARRIDIRLGMEIDYIPGLSEDFGKLIDECGLEYCIGSVHFVSNPEGDPNDLWFIDGPSRDIYDDGIERIFHGDVRKAVTAFFHQNNEMIERNRPAVIGHFDKIVMHNHDRFFTRDEPWFLNLVYETAELISEKGIICEINTRGIYKKRSDDYFPSRKAILRLKELGVPVLVSSDAHEPANLDMFEGAYEYLNEIRYPEIVYEF